MNHFIQYIFCYLVACGYDKWLSFRHPRKIRWIENIFTAALGVLISIFVYRWLFGAQ